MPETVHIVCLDAPAPPDYGGVFDLYYKIPALAAIGTRIILHYFDYREGRSANGLERYCAEIHSYKRGRFLSALIKGQSYIVGSRINKGLIRRLNQDNHAVLLEGIHCAGILPFLNPQRKLVLRLHNNEAAYYGQLAAAEKSLLKRWYFHREQRLLHQFQQALPKSLPTLAVSQQDVQVFREKYGFTNIEFLPCFLPWQDLSWSPAVAPFCLYHGNLRVPENQKAATWLAKEVFTKTAQQLVIAGKGANDLQPLLANQKNIRLIDAPDDVMLSKLIAEAQVHMLPSMNTTGVKIKLLHVLFNGKFCITNKAGIEGSGISSGVYVMEDGEAMAATVETLMQTAFTEDMLVARRDLLALYDNEKNARLLSERL